jgi:hypothetical protein
MAMPAIQCDKASKTRRGLKSQQLEEILHDYDIQNFSDINSSSSSSISDMKPKNYTCLYNNEP